MAYFSASPSGLHFRHSSIVALEAPCKDNECGIKPHSRQLSPACCEKSFLLQRPFAGGIASTSRC